jgi:hypothetical protein
VALVEEQGLMPALYRRETHCPRREATTGWGWLTGEDKFEADSRIRYAAGYDDGCEVEFDPGAHPGRWWKLRWHLDAKKSAA